MFFILILHLRRSLNELKAAWDAVYPSPPGNNGSYKSLERPFQIDIKMFDESLQLFVLSFIRILYSARNWQFYAC